MKESGIDSFHRRGQAGYGTDSAFLYLFYVVINRCKIKKK